MVEKDNVVLTEAALPDDARQALQILVGLIIPASSEYDVPGADDPVIFGEILVAAQSDILLVIDGLKAVDDLSNAGHGERFAVLEESDKVQVARDFAQSQAPHVSAIVSITAQCYYGDERVMNALGIASRAPFPKGYEVEQGDWSLLDPVKQRPKFYREI